MSMGAPSFEPYYDFRIIENFEAPEYARYELQTKKWIGWKTVRRSDNILILKDQARKLRRGYRVVEEFN